MLYWLSQYSDTPLRVFKYLTFRTFGAGLTAMLIVAFFTPMTIRFLKKKLSYSPSRLDGLIEEGYIDRSKEKTPSMGGILIVISIIISTLLWAKSDNLLVPLFIINLMLMATIGFFDDYIKITKPKSKGISSRVKLGGQAIVTLIAVLSLTLIENTAHYTSEFYVPFLKTPLFTSVPIWFYLLFSSTVVIGSSNAVNLTDGMDGLACSCLAICAGAYVVFAYFCGRYDFAKYLSIPHIFGAGEVAIFGATIVGACIGFLWHNCHPASIFMGDTGSLALGSSIGLIAIMVRQEIILTIIGGIFVIEALSVLIQVGYYKKTGKRFFLMAPIHHHFQKKNWTETQIVFRFTIIALLLAFIGLATLKLR